MKKIVLFAALMMGLASCQTQQSLYSWYDSEDATYVYTKRGTEETLAKAMAQYEKVIQNIILLGERMPHTLIWMRDILALH